MDQETAHSITDRILKDIQKPLMPWSRAFSSFAAYTAEADVFHHLRGLDFVVRSEEFAPVDGVIITSDHRVPYPQEPNDIRNLFYAVDHLDDSDFRGLRFDVKYTSFAGSCGRRDLCYPLHMELTDWIQRGIDVLVFKFEGLVDHVAVVPTQYLLGSTMRPADVYNEDLLTTRVPAFAQPFLVHVQQLPEAFQSLRKHARGEGHYINPTTQVNLVGWRPQPRCAPRIRDERERYLEQRRWLDILLRSLQNVDGVIVLRCPVAPLICDFLVNFNNRTYRCELKKWVGESLSGQDRSTTSIGDPFHPCRQWQYLIVHMQAARLVCIPRHKSRTGFINEEFSRVCVQLEKELGTEQYNATIEIDRPTIQEAAEQLIHCMFDDTAAAGEAVRAALEAQQRARDCLEQIKDSDDTAEDLLRQISSNLRSEDNNADGNARPSSIAGANEPDESVDSGRLCSEINLRCIEAEQGYMVPLGPGAMNGTHAFFGFVHQQRHNERTGQRDPACYIFEPAMRREEGLTVRVVDLYLPKHAIPATADLAHAQVLPKHLVSLDLKQNQNVVLLLRVPDTQRFLLIRSLPTATRLSSLRTSLSQVAPKQYIAPENYLDPVRHPSSKLKLTNLALLVDVDSGVELTGVHEVYTHLVSLSKQAELLKPASRMLQDLVDFGVGHRRSNLTQVRVEAARKKKST